MTSQLHADFGVLLSGLTGVGKTTIQNALLERGCWAPVLFTTRTVGGEEGPNVVAMSREQFIAGVVKGDLVVPTIFGGEMYGWTAEDLGRLRSSPGGAVISVRPYTALLLATLLDGLLPVWLFVPEADRQARLTRRRSARDRDLGLSGARMARDAEDAAYADLFGIRVLADNSAVQTTAKLMRLA